MRTRAAVLSTLFIFPSFADAEPAAPPLDDSALIAVSDIRDLLRKIEFGAAEDERLEALAALKFQAGRAGPVEQGLIADTLSRVMADAFQTPRVRMAAAKTLGSVAGWFSDPSGRRQALEGFVSALESAARSPRDAAVESGIWYGLNALLKRAASYDLRLAADRLLPLFYARLQANEPESVVKMTAMMALHGYLSAGGSSGMPGSRHSLNDVARELLQTAETIARGPRGSDDFRGFLYLSLVKLYFRGEVESGIRSRTLTLIEEASRTDPNASIRAYLARYLPIMRRRPV